MYNVYSFLLSRSYIQNYIYYFITLKFYLVHTLFYDINNLDD